MTVLDYILDGFESALVLERELGARAFECDRSLLLPVVTASPPEKPAAKIAPIAAPPLKRPAAPEALGGFVFLHDRPLSGSGSAMIAKILDALKAVKIRTIEVHLTEPKNREDFRRVSYVGMAAEKTFSGRGFESYADAIAYLSGGSAG